MPFRPDLDYLVIPESAGDNDPRIVIDGDGTAILVYSADGLFAEISPTAGVRVQDPLNPDKSIRININEATDPFDPILALSTGDPDENEAGNVHVQVAGAGATRNAHLTIQSPFFTNGAGSTFLELISSSEDGTSEPGRIRGVLSAGGSAGARWLPFGNIRTRIQSADDAIAASTEELVDNLEMSNVLVSGRIYRIEGELSFSAVTTRVVMRLRYTTDGSIPDPTSTLLKLSAFNAVAAGSTGGTGRIVYPEYVPAPVGDTTEAFRVGLFADPDLAITCRGSADQNGFLSITDLGEP